MRCVIGKGGLTLDPPVAMLTGKTCDAHCLRIDGLEWRSEVTLDLNPLTQIDMVTRWPQWNTSEGCEASRQVLRSAWSQHVDTAECSSQTLLIMNV